MLDRTVAPRAKSLDKIDFAEFDRTFLSNGRPLLQIKDDAQPVFNLELIFEGGRSAEKVPGASWYASKLLQEGTKELSSLDVSLKFESLGSFIDIGAGMDYVSFRVYSLKKNIEPTLDLLSEILHNPSLPEEEFDILKQIRTSNINNLMAKNSQFANLSFSEKLYGSNVAYGRILTADLAGKVQLADAIDHYKERLFTNPYVIVMGDFDDQVIKKVDSLVASLGSNYSGPKISQIDPEIGRFNVERSESTQASIRTGNIIVNKNHPKIHSLTISNIMLGGFFGSRLMKTIREEKGLTYGIYSGISHQMLASYWQISAEVQKDKLEEAISAINLEIEKLATIPPTEVELNTLKNYLIGKLQNSMDSIFSIGNMYKSLLIKNQELSFMEDYLERIQSITALEISETVADFLKDKNEVCLVVS